MKILKKKCAVKGLLRAAPTKRRPSKAALVRRWMAHCGWEDMKLAQEALREGGEPIPLERLIQGFGRS
jgi:hypothetical protein